MRIDYIIGKFISNADQLYCNCVDNLENRIGTLALECLETFFPIIMGVVAGVSISEKISGRVQFSSGVLPGFSLLAVVSRLRANDVVAQIEQIKSKSLDNKKRLLILQSTDGLREKITGNFWQRRFAVQLREWAKTHKIEQILISDQASFQQFIDNSLGQYDVIWIRGHGNSYGVRLGNFFLSQNEPQLVHALVAKAKKGSIFLFDSCKVGQGEQNFARAFSYACPSSDVYASQSLHQMVYGLDFEQGIPHFRDIFCQDSTRSYKAGVLTNVASPTATSRAGSKELRHIFH